MMLLEEHLFYKLSNAMLTQYIFKREFDIYHVACGLLQIRTLYLYLVLVLLTSSSTISSFKPCFCSSMFHFNIVTLLSACFSNENFGVFFNWVLVFVLGFVSFIVIIRL